MLQLLKEIKQELTNLYYDKGITDSNLLDKVKKEIMQRERLNEETIEEQEQVKCDYCGRNIEDCDCL
jgi:hypothetical protein